MNYKVVLVGPQQTLNAFRTSPQKHVSGLGCSDVALRPWQTHGVGHLNTRRVSSGRGSWEVHQREQTVNPLGPEVVQTKLSKVFFHGIGSLL